MTVHENVILDLLPTVRSGHASAESRTLVEEYLQANPKLAAYAALMPTPDPQLELRTLEQEAAGLESKWKETIGQDERQDGQIAGLRVQVLEMFKKSVAEIRGWGPRIEEAARTSATAWEASERPSPDPSFADPTQKVV